MLFTTSPDQSGPPISNKQKSSSRSPPPPPQNKWRTGAQERIYNRRLLEGLQSARGAKAVKEAADSALAITAKGQSRWSRAILATRCRRVKVQKAMKARRRCLPKPHMPPVLPPAMMVEKEGEGKLGERLRKLGKLVPGCRKLPATSLLEEAVDYVAALEMQVKAMRALADALSNTSISPPVTTTTAASDSGGTTTDN